MSDSLEVFTVGHSNRAIESFLELLRLHRISAIADVRSMPYSRFVPQFNREELRTSLLRNSVAYVYLGLELGARRFEPECRVEGRVKFELVARSPSFLEGLERVRKGVRTHRVALMCAEKDPIVCHRGILICRALREEMTIHHILEEGRLETHQQTEERLLAAAGLPATDLFHSKAELVDQAYELLSERIAHVEETPDDSPK